MDGSGFSGLLLRMKGEKAESAVSDPLDAMKAELQKIEDFLKQLDTRLNENDPFGGEEVQTLEKILDELKRSKSKHE